MQHKNSTYINLIIILTLRVNKGSLGLNEYCLNRYWQKDLLSDMGKISPSLVNQNIYNIPNRTNYVEFKECIAIIIKLALT